ncbi:glucagon-like peptide 1 receptor, partial [Belonocnema kinseyi]|uniref:glucagon-like peptide 1 receptor n=1 Tax=Belonocnema kinseyi TaxID=2817044 RepID=UPI00143D3A31
SENKILYKWLPIIKAVSQVGYATSFTVLVIAFLTFFLHRKLQNPRNRLHMHLFASFIVRAFMALFKDWLFLEGTGLSTDFVYVGGEKMFIKERNTWVCKAVTSIWQYCIIVNYSWILMEALYLHRLIFSSLCGDTNAITFYIWLGWCLPLLVVIPWVIVRVNLEDVLCWTTNRNPYFFLIIRIPIMIIILFGFLILQVMLVKIILKKSVNLKRLRS